MPFFEVTGIRELDAALGRAGQKVGGATSKAIRASAQRIKSAGVSNAPKGKTLKLSKSIGIDIYGDGRSKGITAVIGPTVRYGPFQEYGTTRNPPHPFMGPAFTAEAPRFEAAIAEAAEEAL